MPYATAFPVRGLLIDKRFGHILKMNRYKFVTKGYHGLRELDKDELRELYHSKKIRPATPRYHWIDTLYALSEASLYAALVDAFERRGLAIDYAQDLRRHPREHRRGAPRRHHPRHRDVRLPPLRRARPRPRPDAAQAPQQREEALPPHQLALAVHRRDDDVPPRRRDGRVPDAGGTTSTSSSSPRPSPRSSRSTGRYGARRRDACATGRVPPRAGQGLRGGQPRTTSSAALGVRATRCSTSATTSTATSCGARRRAPGARR